MVDHFKNHKKYIIRSRRWAFAGFAFCLVFLILCLYIVCTDFRQIWTMPLPLFFMVILFFMIIATRSVISSTRLIKQLSSIQLGKTTDVKISHPKIVFLVVPESTRHRQFRHNRVYGIQIKDKKKYYYLFGECYEYTADDVKKIRAKLSGEFDIQCYEGTSIIRTIQNDPYLIKFQRKFYM